MKEFYKNPKRNMLRHIAYENKSKKLPYLKLVPRYEMKFRKSKTGNILQYKYEILPNNEYRRFSFKSTRSNKIERHHLFSCIRWKTNLVKKLNFYVDDVSSLDEISKRKIIHDLNYAASTFRES